MMNYGKDIVIVITVIINLTPMGNGNCIFLDIENTMQVAMVSNENAKDYVYNSKKDEHIERLSFMTFSNTKKGFRSIRGFQVKGDDMEPNFFHGDWVFV